MNGLGAYRHGLLVAQFGDAARVVQASAREIAAVRGIGPGLAARITRADLDTARRDLRRLVDVGGEVLVPADVRYPRLLREIPDPPPVLFAQGRLDLLALPMVSMVGSRRHSRYGRQAARALSFDAARAGLVVASGMARGIDAVVHEGGLDGGAGSVGVLGNGFGVVYPAANRALYERMQARGCLVTEFAPGERPHAGAFQARNRIVSGLSMVLVVVEAAERSGTAITVQHAIEQGRTVLAVPGPITSATSWGTNRLLRDGAKPALDIDSILEEFGLTGAPSSTASAVPKELSPQESRLWEQLNDDAQHVDDLASALSEPVANVLAMLSTMELKGCVMQEAGHRFVRALS